MRIIIFSSFFSLIFLLGCSNGSKNLVIIEDDLRKTTTKIETIGYGTGGGISGSEANFVKTTIRKYDSLNNLIYKSYKETSFNGCIASTAKLKVISKGPAKNTCELESTTEGTFKIIFKNKNG